MISFKRMSSCEEDTRSNANEPLIPKDAAGIHDHVDPPPFGLAFRSSKVFIIFVVIMAVFTDAFLYAMIIPILPETLKNQAGVLPEDVQKWSSILLSVFGAANLFVSPLAGVMADWTATRRGPLLCGLFALTASTILYCFGRTPMILVLARILQGASAAVLWVVGLALLTDTMGATSAGGAMGWQAIGRFSGMLLGPSLSGIVYDTWGHYAVFYMAFGILFFDIVLRFAMIERKMAERWIPDLNNLNYGTIQTFEPLISPVSLENEPLSRTNTGKSGATFDTKNFTELPSNHDDLNMISLLTSSRILMALWTYFVSSVFMTGLESVLSLYTMDKFGWTASKSGLIFMMLSFSILFDPYIGHLTDRHGCRGLTVLGLLIGIITWSLLCLATSNSTAIIILLSALLFFVGLAAGLMITPNMVEISHAVDFMSQTSQGSSSDPAKVMARAYSLLNMSWGIGSVVGPLWAGAVIETRGWQGMCVSFVVLQLITTGLAYRFAGQQVEKTEGGNQNQI